MDKKMKHTIMWLIAFAIVLFAAITNISAVWNFVAGIGKLILPIIIGLVISFVLNVPMKSFERLIYRFFPKSVRLPKRYIYIISLLLTLLCVGLVLTLVVTIALPEFVESVKSIYSLIKQKLPELTKFLESKNIDTTDFKAWFASIDINSLIDKDGVMDIAERPDDIKEPWYGQLMKAPQTMAYILQIDHWLRKYRVEFAGVS